MRDQRYQARLIRAELRLRAGNPAGTITDLDLLNGQLPREDAVRLQMARLYSGADAFDAAIAQYDLWMAAHRDDSHRSSAQNGRCWSRMLADKDLDKALGDCNAAVQIWHLLVCASWKPDCRASGQSCSQTADQLCNAGLGRRLRLCRAQGGVHGQDAAGAPGQGDL